MRLEPIRFLRTCFRPDDWIAVFLKNYQDGRVVQRVGALSWVASDPVQAWLRAMNAHRFNVYVSVNAIGAGRRSRTRDAVVGIRHVFLEVDRDGPGVLRLVDDRADLPSPSYVLHSSENRVHIFWRVEAFDADCVERLQKHLANEFGTDPAATPVTQTTRMPGYDNHKYDEPYRVWIEYRDVDRVFQPPDFPRADPHRTTWQPLRGHSHAAGARSRMERARLYISRVPPAVAGQHGDVHTFRTCCRLTRGFALEDDQALAVLTDGCVLIGPRGRRTVGPRPSARMSQRLTTRRRSGPGGAAPFQRTVN